MTDLIERLLAYRPENEWGDGVHHTICDEAADAIQSRDEEIASLRLDVATQEALQDSAYKAGLKAGRNFGEAGDEAGYQRAMASTEHVAELQRIRSARAALEKRA